MDLLVAPPETLDTLEPELAEPRILRSWDVLLPLSVALWLVGINKSPTKPLGQYGLPTSLPPVFYAGLILAIVSIGFALSMAQLSPIRLRAHLGVLILMLYGTAPMVYAQARYAWLYKYIGVAQYVNSHGHVNQHIDIFQNWPGFFAFIAWFDNAVGVQNPVAYAKWAQLVFELLICIMLSYVFRGLPLTDRERWLALFLYAGSMWIAQDYLSAQALGVVISLGLFGLALHHLPRTNEPKWLVALRTRVNRRRRLRNHVRHSSRWDDAGWPAVPESSRRKDAAVVAALCLIYFVLVFEHELSPYVVLIQFACLAIIGRLRQRWIVLIFAAIALGYFAPRFGYVNSRFGLTNSFGNFFGNATPPLVSLGSHAKVTAGITFSAHASRYLTVGMWLFAAVGAVRRWRSGRPTLALVLLAYSPAFIFFAGAYGNEGLLRVYLFSLPWTACLVASAIQPVAAGISIDSRSPVIRQLSRLGACKAPIALAVAIALFFPAFFGDDSSYFMSTNAVQGSLAFYNSAAPGTLFDVDANFPSAINRYNDFPEIDLYGTNGILKHPVYNGTTLTKIIERANPRPNQPTYIIFSDSMQAYAIAYGFLPSNGVARMRNAINDAPGWFQIYNKPGFTVFELPPVA